MNCDSVRERLGPYLDAELDADTVGMVEAHLANCTDCAEELEALSEVARRLGPSETDAVPHALWPAIERRLAAQPMRGGPFDADRARRRPLIRPAWAIAALVALGAGLSWLGLSMTGSKAAAATVDFGVLLDAIELDPRLAFRKFVDAYQGRPGTRAEAARYARGLNFALPDELPHGFKLREVYLLRFGKAAGIAATYDREGEFLAAIFHPPVPAESYGTHEDYDCVIGKHRGHKVQVGEWKLVHLTDPTTCHCVLSRLDEHEALPAVIAAVAPAL